MNLRDKLAKLVDRSTKVKLAYRQLQSQITFGLVEIQSLVRMILSVATNLREVLRLLKAAEVFDSLAIPLMKLVGLKTSEMESEGRTSTFIFKTERYHMDTARNGARSSDLNTEIRNSKEENYAAKAESAGKEILHKNKGQLRQLVHMLRHIETDVNSHREDILQMIDNRRTFFQDFIQKALYYLSSIHRENHGTFPVTVKFLRVLFTNINEVLGSVDSGVNDLMQALAKNMCYPMTNYVGNLAAEIKLGPCVQLMNVVNEMERANSDTRRELQDARKRIRLAEETKIDALLRLKQAEEQVQRMKTNSDIFLLPASQKKQEEHSVTGKRMGIEGSRENEEKLLWKLLGKRRKQQEPESPMGPRELIRQADTKQKCDHYKRRCRIRAPCCNEVFACRHCHNESTVICSVCDTEQPATQVCSNCGVNMGEYFCNICKFYDDDIEKKQFHCDDCGICRVGGRENFYHCKKCGSCYAIGLRNNHRCVENSMRHHFPICYEYLFASLKDTNVMKCGHTMHVECYNEMIKRDKFCCPICSRSVIDMSKTWQRLDEEIEATAMLSDYRDKKVLILCNDCNHTTEVYFHIIGQKCGHCRSYNTRAIAPPVLPQ